MVKELPTLLVVESPAKTKTIQKYLGPKYVVRATVGHIVDLATKGTKYSLGVDLDKGFKPKYVVMPDKRDKIAAILDAAKQSKMILLATDDDREGEAIAHHVADQLSKIDVPIKRITFNEITKAKLEHAIANPKELNDDVYNAQQARRVLDRIVGFMVSPYLMNKMGSKLSAGRVQSVALRLVVEKEKEIEAFVPEVYWNVTAALAKKGTKDSFVARYPKRVTKEAEAKKIKKDLDESTFVVTKVEASEVKKNPYPPLTTSKMQQSGSARYKFAASRTMKAAQSLYESGHVTYIRSDSTRNAPEAINAVRGWIKQNGHDVPAKPNVYKNKDSAQDAHEAIRPTNIDLLPSQFVGSDDQKKIYKLIWERFVASQMKPAIFDTVAVTIKASKGHELKANGRTLKYPGWLAVTQDISKDKEDDIQLPALNVKDDLVLVPPKVKAEKKETKPPSRFTEGTLVRDLEKKGIGRPSTYASIIDRISNRNYVKKTKNSFSPTPLGVQVTEILQSYFSFMKYDYTAEMEAQLDKIANGELGYVKMLGDFFEPFKEELKQARASTYKDGGHDCDKCGKRMILKHGKYGFFIACSGYPDCKNVKGVELDGDKINIRERHKVIEDVLCPDCKAGMVRRDGKFGPFYSCSTYPKCKGIRKIPFGKKCSDCGNELYMTAFKGTPKLACMGYPSCKHIEDVPRGTDVNWIDPNKITPKKNKKVERILDGK